MKDVSRSGTTHLLLEVAAMANEKQTPPPAAPTDFQKALAMHQELKKKAPPAGAPVSKVGQHADSTVRNPNKPNGN